MGKIAAIWARIETRIRSRMPVETRSLPAGAPVSAIEDVVGAVGLALPKSVRESYALHDGSAGIWVCEHGFLLPLIDPRAKKGKAAGFGVLNIWQMMLRVAEMMKDERSNPVGPIRDDYWNRCWLPMTENECGDYACLDLAPAKGGKKGQIIEWMARGGATRVLASDFTQWLEGMTAEPGVARARPRD